MPRPRLALPEDFAHRRRNPRLPPAGCLRRHGDFPRRRRPPLRPPLPPARHPRQQHHHARHAVLHVQEGLPHHYRPHRRRVHPHKEINTYASFSRAAEPVTQLVSLTATRADFSLQKGRQYEAGLKGTFVRGKLDATVAVFDLLKKDLLTSTTDPVTGIWINQQIGAQKSQGIEAALAIYPGDGWRVELNGAFTDASYADFNENLGTGIISRAGRRPGNVPACVANAFVAKRFSHGFALSGGPRYASDRFGNTNNSVVADGYVVLDASASYTYRRTTFTLRGRNLLDETYEPVAGTTMRRLSDPRTAELSLRTSF